MSQISPKQIDWSQQISGSLLPYVSGSETISNFSLGNPSSSWGHIYVGNADITGSINAQNSEFETILVKQRSELRGITSITGSVRISGSLEVIGPSTFSSQKESTPSLTVAGQLEVINQQISSSVQRARITIQNLGEVGNRESSLVLDLGGFF